MGPAFFFAQRCGSGIAVLLRLGVLILAVLNLSSALVGQASSDSPADSGAGVGVPDDWSHHHLVFSTPTTAEQARRVQQDPRYWQQLARRSRGSLKEMESPDASPFTPDPNFPLPSMHSKRRQDWQQDMNAGATVGAGQYPAKYSLNVNSASCSDFVVFNTGLAGSSSQASIIAYTNLYVGCSGTVPSVYWAYDTGGGTITTSVALSANGTQLAFVQAEGGVATLVVLKWAASTTETASAPMVLSSTSSYRTCTAPCMTTLTFTAGSGESGTITDTYSSPYYNYASGSDTLYVGDDIGFIHQFTGVFNGTPAETTTDWPAEAATAKLSSPIFDNVSGNVFVTASFQVSNNSGGRLHAVCATTTCGTAGVTNESSGILGPDTKTGACHATATSGDASNLRLDAPIVDSTAGKVYVFIGNDGTGESAVYQFPTTLTAGSCGTTETTVGTGSTTGVTLFAGDFDNIYYTSTSGTSPTGNLYVCGNTSGEPTLYQIPITSDAMATTSNNVLAVSTASSTCSPLTEVYSASTDLMFLSVVSSSTTSPIDCSATTGCLMSFSLPTSVGGTLPTAPTATLAAAGGTSGLIIDNLVPTGTLHTEQVYFSPLSNETCNGTASVGCAVQASQSALQ
jgi:hypothetical protein